MKRRETGQGIIDSRISDTHLRPLTTSCDNIWLHRGWHAPCELPRTRSSSALAVGLWILAQNFHRRKRGNMFTSLLKMNTNTWAPEGDYLCTLLD
jgi:hypothetical protein